MRKVLFNPRRFMQGYICPKETFEDNGERILRRQSMTSNKMGINFDERRGIDGKKKDVVVQTASNR